MNIHGIGTDIVNIKELKTLLIKIKISKKRFLPLLKLAHAKKELIRLIVLLKDSLLKKHYLKLLAFPTNFSLTMLKLKIIVQVFQTSI